MNTIKNAIQAPKVPVVTVVGTTKVGTNKFFKGKNGEAVQHFSYVLDVNGEEKTPTFTEIGLEDSVTAIAFGTVDGIPVVAVKREWKSIPKDYLTTSAGTGYFSADEGYVQGSRNKLADEAGLENVEGLEIHDFSEDMPAYPFPQTVKGAHYYLGFEAKADNEILGLFPEGKKVHFLPVFKADALKLGMSSLDYGKALKTHEILWMGTLLVRDIIRERREAAMT